MASGNAKRRQKQQHQKQHAAQKQHHREQTHDRSHLPKVGTPADDAYIQRRRRADLVDFGLGSGKATQWIGVAIAVFIVFAFLIFFFVFL